MINRLRPAGIKDIHHLPWGTHFCNFYQTKNDLIDILVPYFIAGLENNEFCVWAASDPLPPGEAEVSLRNSLKALKRRKNLKDLDSYLKTGQMELLDASSFYTTSGRFDLDKVLRAWAEKLEHVSQGGFDGIRCTGNVSWLNKKDWNKFIDYEIRANAHIGRNRALALCTYSLGQCSPSEIIDVVNSHHFTLLKKLTPGEWKAQIRARAQSISPFHSSFHSPSQARAQAHSQSQVPSHSRDKAPAPSPTLPVSQKPHQWQLKANPYSRQLEERLRIMDEAIESSLNAIAISDIAGNLTYVNPSFLSMWGYQSSDEVIQKSALEFWLNPDEPRQVIKTLHQCGTWSGEMVGKRKDGTIFDVHISTNLVRDTSGKPKWMMGSFLDISGRKQKEEKLIQYQRKLEASEREIKSFSHKVLSIREEEKKNLAAALHNETGALSVALNSALSSIEQGIGRNNPKSALLAASRSKLILSRELQRLKGIAADLRPPDLELVGLPSALREYFRKLEKKAGIKIEFRTELARKKVTEKNAIVLFRIAQEALNNIIAHSHATKAIVRLYASSPAIKLLIRDNGKGFEIENRHKGQRESGARAVIRAGARARTGAMSRKKLGLRIMKELAEARGGTLILKSAPGSGTEITVTLPL